MFDVEHIHQAGAQVVFVRAVGVQLDHGGHIGGILRIRLADDLHALDILRGDGFQLCVVGDAAVIDIDLGLAVAADEGDVLVHAHDNTGRPA